MWENVGKVRTRITPNTGTFYAVKLNIKVNRSLNFLHRKNKYLTSNLYLLLYKTLIQTQFDYACSALCPNLSKNLKNRTEASQNKRVFNFAYS